MLEAASAPTERRLAAFAAAGLDESKMRKWALIRCAYLGADEQEVAVLALVGDTPLAAPPSDLDDRTD